MKHIKNSCILSYDVNKGKDGGKISIGVFKDVSLPEHTKKYQRLISKVNIE